MIKSITLNSSMLLLAEYNDETQELTVTFNNSGEYKYFDVPPEIFSEMTSQKEAIGKWFTANIKNKYRYEKV